MSDIRKVKTWLPVFPGFFKTPYEYDEVGEVESIMSYCNFIEKFTEAELEVIKREDILFDALYENVDYEKYEEDVANKAANCILSQFNCGIKSFEIERIIHPREYNFASDSVNITIEIDFSVLIGIIYSNIEYLNQWFKDNYTIRDGFIPSYPNDFDGWQEETNYFQNLDGHYLGAILNAFYHDGVTMSEEINDCDAVVLENIAYSSYYDIDKVIDAVKEKLSEKAIAVNNQ